MISQTFGYLSDGQEITEFCLKNADGMTLRVINYGCAITALHVQDRYGRFENIVLSYDSLDDYLSVPHYPGCIVGRYANRISNGRFSIDGEAYEVSLNHASHHLHGGYHGLDKVVWHGSFFEESAARGIEFSYTSPDGDDGYPGNLNLHVRYVLTDDNAVILSYTATTDKKTIINLTNHSYFNLNPACDDILSHQLEINADHFLAVTDELIPTGELRAVIGTAFDFRSAKAIGAHINDADPQLLLARGYDHTWVLQKREDALSFAAMLTDQQCGRRLEVFTTEPGMQVYTANWLNKKLTGFDPYSAVCLETQHFPDSPHHPHFPSVVLEPGKKFQSTTEWRFSCL